MRNVIIIGAGASGMMAAARAAELGAKVLLLEKTDKPGKKILLSGKTRCNLTNSKPLDDFITMYGPNGRFLYSAFHRFFRDELLTLLNRYGIKTKTEPDGRIFPASDNSHDVVNALQCYMAQYNVQIQSNTKVNEILVENGHVTAVRTEHALYPTETAILATGGSSYPGTGSSGDGYRIAKAIGHNLVRLRPSLVPLEIEELELARKMQGTSLSDVRVTAYKCPAEQINDCSMSYSNLGQSTGRKKHPIIDSRQGDLMITHFGITGPVVLKMSLSIVDALDNSPVSVTIDLIPNINKQQLDQQLQHNFDIHGKRTCKRMLTEFVPPKMVDTFLAMIEISPNKPSHQITADERKRIVKLLKSLHFNIKRPLPITSAMVTAGGVSLKEIEPRTLESLLVKGLYFCGEVMDIDAETGGFNLQAAFSTGYVAGENAVAIVSTNP